MIYRAIHAVLYTLGVYNVEDKLFVEIRQRNSAPLKKKLN